MRLKMFFRTFSGYIFWNRHEINTNFSLCSVQSYHSWDFIFRSSFTIGFSDWYRD